MTDTIDTSPGTGGPKGGLGGKLLPELKTIATSLGIKSAGLKKADLVSAIRSAQNAGPSNGAPKNDGVAKNGSNKNRSDQNRPNKNLPEPNGSNRLGSDPAPADRPTGTAGAGSRDNAGDTSEHPDRGRAERAPRQERRRDGADSRENNGGNRPEQHDEGAGQRSNRHDEQPNDDDADRQNNRNNNRSGNNRNQGGGSNNRNQSPAGAGRNETDEDGSRRNRRRRGRDRAASPAGGGNNRSNRNEPDTTVLEDDVLVPCAGILDVLDNYAFVRTSGYLPGNDDCYVSLSMVRRLGLRRGDAITGQVRQPRDGERKEKFNPLVLIETVNGADPEATKSRVEFQKLTPLYPSERLRLETGPTNLIGRVVDIAAPIGKGQRGLIVSPSKAGKTMIMQSIANSITTNNPECHLMVVLVDERPEEVTDFERSVKGEVISSTFDRPASDHTIVAELAIERAKRLVELGHDVVVLLDGITRLGRAYNLAAPASGRILSGGVDSAALYPPKRFFGAARNIENGGSLTILATALIESGSKMDEVIFEEFKGTGNMELRLRRDFADKRIFPAIDAVQSGTRREELLMSKEELAIIWKLRRVLSGLDGQQALELLLERLKKTQTNLEFLMQVQKTTPTAGGNGD